MDGASISQQKQKRLKTHSDSAPLEQLASAFCEGHMAHIHFQPSGYCDVTTDESQSSSSQSSDQQAKDTLLSIVRPHLCRNRCRHRFIEGSKVKVLSLDHTKLLAEAARNFKVSLCFSHEPEKQPPNFSRTCGNRTRIKWTADLHQKFVNCVNLLGGAQKATPRAIVKLMKSNGLTVFHVKSHLQKYRCAKCITNSTKLVTGKPEQQVEDHDDLLMIYLKSGMQVKEILRMQQEVQRHLCQQLEIQQNIHQALEEQGKQIEMMLGQLKKQK